MSLSCLCMYCWLCCLLFVSACCLVCRFFPDAYLQDPRALQKRGQHALLSPWARCKQLVLVRETGGAPRNPAPRNHLLGADCRTIRLPPHRWALDKHICHWGLTDIAGCRPPLGALPLSLSWAGGRGRRSVGRHRHWRSCSQLSSISTTNLLVLFNISTIGTSMFL